MTSARKWATRLFNPKQLLRSLNKNSLKSFDRKLQFHIPIAKEIASLEFIVVSVIGEYVLTVLKSAISFSSIMEDILTFLNFFESFLKPDRNSETDLHFFAESFEEYFRFA